MEKQSASGKRSLFSQFRGPFRRRNHGVHHDTAERARIKSRHAAGRGPSGRNDRVAKRRGVLLPAPEHHQGAPVNGLRGEFDGGVARETGVNTAVGKRHNEFKNIGGPASAESGDRVQHGFRHAAAEPEGGKNLFSLAQILLRRPGRAAEAAHAGTGKRGFSGDGDRKCTDSAFSNPTGLAVDKRGRLYISDTDNQRIRRLTVESQMDSKVVTVVGSGERGYNGDGMDAWDAKLAYPGALVITRHDMLFLVDTGNNLVRRVQAISTVEPPVKYTGYGQADAQPDERNFLQVLFGGKK